MSGSSQKEAVAYGRPLVLSRGGPARPQAKRRRSFKPKPPGRFINRKRGGHNESLWTQTVGRQHAHGAQKHYSHRGRHSGEGLQLSPYPGKPFRSGNTCPHCIACTLRSTVHEEQHLSSLEGFDFGAAIKKSETQEGLSRSKAEIIERLRTEGERWSRWVEQLSDDLLEEQVWMPGGISKNRFEMLLGRLNLHKGT